MLLLISIVKAKAGIRKAARTKSTTRKTTRLESDTLKATRTNSGTRKAARLKFVTMKDTRTKSDTLKAARPVVDTLKAARTKIRISSLGTILQRDMALSVMTSIDFVEKHTGRVLEMVDSQNLIQDPTFGDKTNQNSFN